MVEKSDMNFRRIGGALAAVALMALCPTSELVQRANAVPIPPAYVYAGDTEVVPQQTAPSTLITNELNVYSGFPSGVALPSGSGYLIGYGVSDQHFDNTTTHRFRWSPDGVTWSGSWTPSVGADMGFAGIAAETTEQGGRIFALQVKVVLTSQTVTGVTPYFRYSDDNGRNWSTPVQLAGGGVRSPASAPQTWTFYPGSIAVLADGSLIASGYGGTNGHVLVRKSTDRGVTWTAAGDISPPAGRILQEPQLCPLADGRIAMTMRSDASSSQWLYMAIRDTGGTWGTPRVITFDGSGAPTCAEIEPGFIAYQYRGWIDRSDDTKRPVRYAAMGVDQGTPGRGNIWLDPDDTGRFLYGLWLPKPDGSWLIVHAVEGPNGAGSPSASIWSTPVRFQPAPAIP